MNVAIHRRFDAGMTEQFLQHFWLHPAFDCTRCIGVAQCVHTESPDSCLIAQFVKVGIIGTVFRWLSCSPVDKNKITHDQLCHAAASTIHVFQSLLQHRRRFSFFPAVPHFTEDAIGRVCQRNGTVAVRCFGGPARHDFVPCRNSSVLFTVRVLAFQSMASHVSPITSPVRSPVSKIRAYCA